MYTSIKNLFGLLAILFFVIGCNKQEAEKGFSIKGKINNAPGSYIVLHEFTPKGLLFIDSAEVNADGVFEFKGSLSEPVFCVIPFNNAASIFLVDTNAEIMVSIDANNPEQFTVNGSPETEKLKSLLKLNSDYQRAAMLVEQKFAAYKDNIPPVSVQNQIRYEFDSIMKARDAAIKQFAVQTDQSLVPFFATNFLLPRADFEFLKQIDQKFYNKFSNSKYAQELHERVMNLSKTASGSTAPDIVLQDPFGKPIALSSLRGKIVLVDFWASWCRPCREESPRLVKLYNKYKTKGFDIFSVSLDDNREAWQKAINDDKLLWTHVSDLLKWNSAVVSQYNIEAIPFTVLVDAEGKIIATGLRGEALEQKLAELMP